MRIKPYGKWWQHFLRGNLRMVYRALFGWKVNKRESLLIDNMSMVINLSIGMDTRA